MTTDKLKVVDSKLQRGGSELSVSAIAGSAEAAVLWWRKMILSVGSGRKRRVRATLERLAQANVEDTLSEADVKSWLSVLESESGSPGAKSVSKRSKPHKPNKRPSQ